MVPHQQQQQQRHRPLFLLLQQHRRRRSDFFLVMNDHSACIPPGSTLTIPTTTSTAASSSSSLVTSTNNIRTTSTSHRTTTTTTATWPESSRPFGGGGTTNTTTTTSTTTIAVPRGGGDSMDEPELIQSSRVIPFGPPGVVACDDATSESSMLSVPHSNVLLHNNNYRKLDGGLLQFHPVVEYVVATPMNGGIHHHNDDDDEDRPYDRNGVVCIPSEPGRGELHLPLPSGTTPSSNMGTTSHRPTTISFVMDEEQRCALSIPKEIMVPSYPDEDDDDDDDDSDMLLDEVNRADVEADGNRRTISSHWIRPSPKDHRQGHLRWVPARSASDVSFTDIAGRHNHKTLRMKVEPLQHQKYRPHGNNMPEYASV
jgi:hypothetical protein